MNRVFLSRILGSAATLLGMSMLAFLLVALAPGDPITAELRFMGVPANPATVDALRRQYDLDAPITHRYVRWIGRVVRLDLGTSIANGRPVTDELVRALPSTLALALLSLGFIVVLSLGAGAAASLRPGGFGARILQALTVAVSSVPLYWLALAAVVVGSVTLGVTTVVSATWKENLLLPSMLLAMGPGLTVGRVVRQKIIDERLEDYVRLSAVVGQAPWRILVLEIGRVVVPSLASMWANSFGFLLGGSVVIERIFDRPGLGNLALQAIAARDYPVLQAYLMLAGLLFIAVNWTADLFSAWADPRLRRGGIHA
jgi:ABC-type dipeptide/oligopeptide/nickel transport system permease component